MMFILLLQMILLMLMVVVFIGGFTWAGSSPEKLEIIGSIFSYFGTGIVVVNSLVFVGMTILFVQDLRKTPELSKKALFRF